MAPTVSPKKSWEGLAGSVVLCLLAGLYSEETEVPYFAFSGITAIVLGGALLAGAPAIRKAMSGVR